MTYTTDPQARAEFVGGLHALAELLAHHGDLPVPQHETNVTVYPHGSDDDKRAEVDRIAHSLDVLPACDLGLYRAVKSFGPVAYQAVLLPEAKLAATEALMSYSSAFEPREA